MTISDLSLLKFSKLDIHGVKILVEWAEKEGWNPGLSDAEIFFSTDPNGFYGYFLDGQMVAGGSLVSYQGKYGFMGFFIVRPEFRSLGIGRALWHLRRDTLLSRLEPGAPIGMDGVVSMQPFYAKGGFRSAFRDERYVKTGISSPVHQNISSCNVSQFREILEYDRQCFGLSRPEFMIPWLTQPEAKPFRFTDHGKLCGFALMRKAVTGYKIGPLFADTPEIADAIYAACLDAVPGEPVFLDIPVNNQGAVDLVRKYTAGYVFECARMYYGKEPVFPIEKVFGITTFELG